MYQGYGYKGGVIFGHHEGDVQENVISNVMRGVSPLLLSGMLESSISSGVTVWRPLLDHNKDTIFKVRGILLLIHMINVTIFRIK